MVLLTRMRDDLRHQTEDIIRYYGELNRRVANAGLTGIPNVLELAKQLEIALGEVAGKELEWAAAEIKRLLGELVAMDGQIQRLRELKVVLEGAQDDADPHRYRQSL